MEDKIFTQEQMDELIALRREKKVLELTKMAENHLEKYGAPKDFAAFLIREGEEDTLDAVQKFSESYGRAKVDFVKSAPTPKDERIVQRVSRGVKRK